MSAEVKVVPIVALVPVNVVQEIGATAAAIGNPATPEMIANGWTWEMLVAGRWLECKAREMGAASADGSDPAGETQSPDAWRYRRNRDYEDEPWRFSPIDPTPSDDPERTIFREMFEVEPLYQGVEGADPMSAEREADFVKLIAYADAMLVEQRRERQERFDAEHPECGGMVGPAEPMDSAARTYVYWRVQWSDALGLPRALTALRPPITPICSET